MTAVPFPLLSAPGRHPQASGGRLINVYPDKLSETAGQKLAYWRVPGLKAFAESTGTTFRGALEVVNLVYAVFDTKCWTFASDGTATELPGTVPGTAPVFIARDNASTPHIVIVSPGDGAVIVDAGEVKDYPDPDVGQPSGVTCLKSFFIFTYGDGTVRNSDANSLNINSLNVAAAESKPDTLYRPVQLGNGQLLLCGSASCEVWGNQNDVGFIFQYIATINRGIIGPYAIAGAEDGFGKGLFAATDDFTVSRLDGYQWTTISSPDVDDAIAAEPNKAGIVVSCYVSRGRGFVTVSGTDWCWEFDTKLETWHERQSYLRTDWRGLFPFKAFEKWLCGDKLSGRIFEIDGPTQDEIGEPLRMRIETGPFGAFPSPVRVNGIELYVTKGVGIAPGTDPTQTDPDLEISMSKDGGLTWSPARSIKVGRQSLTAGRVRSSIWGTCDDVQGVRWRFDESSNVTFGFLGADMQADQLR